MMRGPADLEDLPIGTRVRTPSGLLGTVTRHKGRESRRDLYMRVTVRLDSGGRNGFVTLQPQLLHPVMQALSPLPKP